jgi:transposase
MAREPEEIDTDDGGEVVQRVAAIDVANASGKVCTRVPHPNAADRRVTKVWDVGATTNTIMELADELSRQRIERIVVESTSDYWRPFVYLLQARGLLVWLVNARDVKQVPGRPKTDLLTELVGGFAGWSVRLQTGLARFAPPDQRRGCAAGVVRLGGAAARLA